MDKVSHRELCKATDAARKLLSYSITCISFKEWEYHHEPLTISIYCVDGFLLVAINRSFEFLFQYAIIYWLNGLDFIRVFSAYTDLLAATAKDQEFDNMIRDIVISIINELLVANDE